MKPHLHVSHLVSNDESAGQSLVSVEGAASCRVTCSRHWGVSRGSPYISACQPHGYIVVSPKLLVPTVHILERTLRISVHHLEEGAQCCAHGTGCVILWSCWLSHALAGLFARLWSPPYSVWCLQWRCIDKTGSSYGEQLRAELFSDLNSFIHCFDYKMPPIRCLWIKIKHWRKRSWPMLNYCPSIYLERLSKTRRTLSQDNHILAKNRKGDVRKKSSCEWSDKISVRRSLHVEHLATGLQHSYILLH